MKKGTKNFLKLMVGLTVIFMIISSIMIAIDSKYSEPKELLYLAILTYGGGLIGYLRKK